MTAAQPMLLPQALLVRHALQPMHIYTLLQLMFGAVLGSSRFQCYLAAAATVYTRTASDGY